MKYTAKCPQCDRLFETTSSGHPFKSQAQADQAVRMHIGRTHSRTINSPMSGPGMRKSLSANGRIKVVGGRQHGTDVIDTRSASLKSERPRRKYTRRTGSSQAEPAYQQMCYCPRCGLNLQALATGMAVAVPLSR